MSGASHKVAKLPPLDPQLGTLLLDKWRLDRVLGKGGMSTVYLATHRNGSQVAIKLLRPELVGNTRIQERFLREGYIANRVDHPGAVRVLDDGFDQQRAFLVMELLSGLDVEALRQRRGGAFSASEAAWLVLRATEIVEAAHAANIIHRDIKPQNLFLTTEGQVKLLDFGIASLRGVPGFTTLTDAAAQPGTPGFMAPEQIRGQQAVGPRTDVWALGATLFRLLSGRTIHVASTAGEMMVLTATEVPVSLSSVVPDLPQALTLAVDRALALDPEQRWANATELRLALERASTELPELHAPTPSAECEEGEITWDPSTVEDSQQRVRRDNTRSQASYQESEQRPGAKPVRILLLSAAGLLLAALGYGLFGGTKHQVSSEEAAGLEKAVAPLASVGALEGVQLVNRPLSSLESASPSASAEEPLTETTQVLSVSPSVSRAPHGERPTRPATVSNASKSKSATAPSAERDLLKRRQ